jgi:outer membrane lipase/esterase
MSGPSAFRSSCQAIGAISCLAVIAGHAGTSYAQIQGGLPAVPGLTDLQEQVAVGIQTTCIKITSPPISANPSGGALIDKLANSCTRMVGSALANQGNSVLSAFDLRISDQQLATGTQALSAVQANAQKQIGREASKASMISARLAGLRGGARGLVVGLNGDDGRASGTAGFAGATGGAAAAGDIDGPWGGFVNVSYAWGNVDQTDLQDPYKYGSFSVMAGADYRVNDNVVLGAAFTYSDTRSNYDNNLGDVKAGTTGVVGYGTWYKDEWFVDGLLGYGSVDYDMTRNIYIPSNNPNVKPINATATSSPRGEQWSAAIGVGRNYAMGTWTLIPSARLGYIWVRNKAYAEYEPVEGVGLAVDERTIRSLQSALGAKASTNVNTTSGVFGPYAAAYWMHEFENDNPSIVTKYVADPTNTFFAIPTAGPTRDYAVLTLGSTGTFPDGWAGFAQISAAVGLKNETNYAAVLGIRKQF